MNRPTTYSDRSASHRRADSVGVQTSALFTTIMTGLVAFVVAICIALSKWRAAVAGEITPFGTEAFPHDFDLLASVGDFVLGTSWLDLVKNLVAIGFFIFMVHLLRPVLPFGHNKS